MFYLVCCIGSSIFYEYTRSKINGFTIVIVRVNLFQMTNFIFHQINKSIRLVKIKS